MSAESVATAEGIAFAVRDGVATVTLDRPKALNALTHGMVTAFAPRLAEWAADDRVRCVVIKGAGERAFCAGGDVVTLYRTGKGPDGRITPSAAAFFRDEYRLNRTIHRFPKPYVALLDGVTMGGGVGLSVHGSHRIATERTLFAMPETGIGLFPDVGGGWFLPRCPGEIGAYLGLTGARLRAADALYAGVATQALPADRLEELEGALQRLDWSDDPLADVDRAIAAIGRLEPGPAMLAERRADIDACFAGDSVEAILAALEARGDWGRETATGLAGKSPLSLKVTLRLLREGAGLEIEEELALEYRLVNRFMAGHDFFEGVRALLVDKDNRPAWRPASLAETDDSAVASYFAPLPAGDELTF